MAQCEQVCFEGDDGAQYYCVREAGHRGDCKVDLGVSVDIPSSMRKAGYDAGVEAERERCLALVEFHKRIGKVTAGLLDHAIRSGLPVEAFEKLEAKLRGGGDDD